MNKRIKIKADNSEIKKNIRKVKKLRKLLKEANSLVDELASKPIDTNIGTRARIRMIKQRLDRLEQAALTPDRLKDELLKVCREFDYD